MNEKNLNVPTLTYQEARDQILTGDTIAVEEKKGILALLTRFFTHSDYTHVGIAFWGIDGGLWMTELNGGKNHAIPLSQLENNGFSVYHPPVELREKRASIMQAIHDNLRIKIPYGYLAFLVIGIINFFKINVFIHARRILVCSGFNVKNYEDAGWSEHTRILSPGDLTKLLEIRFRVKNK